MSRKNLETRKRILESCLKLLEEGTGNAVRMSDIAKAAKLSRQAVYLHFPTRAELLIAAARHLDEIHDTDARLAKSRSATAGIERLEAFIDAWGTHITFIQGVAKALLAMKDQDSEADAAWRDRMTALRHGCQAAVEAMKRDETLNPELSVDQATDLLWTLLSVPNWQQLTGECGWSQAQYVDLMKKTARKALT